MAWGTESREQILVPEPPEQDGKAGHQGQRAVALRHGGVSGRWSHPEEGEQDEAKNGFGFPPPFLLQDPGRRREPKRAPLGGCVSDTRSLLQAPRKRRSPNRGSCRVHDAEHLLRL